jgi:propionyl-CoA synthetase
VASAEPADCVPVDATDPLYILYTSGTTGQAKGIVRDTGGHAVALKWSMKNIYDVEPGEVYWAASDVGWVVGHSYIVYAPLGERCDPDTLRWAQEQLGVPVIDHWWQTETGWAIAADCIGIEHLPVLPGSPTRPVPG